VEFGGRKEDCNVSVAEKGSQLELAAALERVLRSKTFSRADSIRQILKFIVEKSIEGNADSIKEYSIATEGLGRPPDFDPKADSIVRIQVQRLRKRLEEYYHEEGAGDPVRIEIPAGHYVPTFHAFPAASPPVQIPEPIPEPQPRQPSIDTRRILSNRILLALVVTLLGVIAVMGYRLSRTPAPVTTVSAPPRTLATSYASLWRGFLPPSGPPLIVFSDPLFLRDEYNDLHQFSLSSSHSLPFGARVPSLSGLERISPVLPRVGNLYYWDLYTGTGEVVAAAQIAQFLTHEEQTFSIVRSGLVSSDQTRDTNVIFLGGPGENAHLESLALQSDLAFAPSDKGYQSVLDRHPTAGRPSSYPLKRDPKTGEIMTDYALISLLPGAVPDRYRMVLAGITTLGTQATAEFATSLSQMSILEKMRRGSAGQTPRSPYFQTLLEVQIRGGAVTGIDCLLVRELQFR
jgi:hypothetical protein